MISAFEQFSIEDLFIQIRFALCGRLETVYGLLLNHFNLHRTMPVCVYVWSKAFIMIRPSVHPSVRLCHGSHQIFIYSFHVRNGHDIEWKCHWCCCLSNDYCGWLHGSTTFNIGELNDSDLLDIQCASRLHLSILYFNTIEWDRISNGTTYVVWWNIEIYGTMKHYTMYLVFTKRPNRIHVSPHSANSQLNHAEFPMCICVIRKILTRMLTVPRYFAGKTAMIA